MSTENDTSRVEAFSDGVFAIAITLLILEIRVPALESIATDGALVAALGHLWPSLFAFVFSFAVILIMWINHHELMRWVSTYDYPFLFANGILLLMVTFVPFPTAVVARHLGTGAARAAVAFYCATFFCISVAYGLLFLSIAYKRRLVRPAVPDAVVARVRRAYGFGAVVYGLSVALAWWNAVVALVVCASLWIVWSRLCYQPFEEHGSPAA